MQRSNQLASGTPNPAFTTFGMAWYQSDVETDSSGAATVTVKTILLDQIFGFDPGRIARADQHLQCGLLVRLGRRGAAVLAHPLAATPFNGEHNAGPVAFITRPNSKTGLGPLCTAPEKSGSAFICKTDAPTGKAH